jgi:oligopeptide transport system ATP-binding protein
MSPLLELIDVRKVYGSTGLFSNRVGPPAVDGITLQLHRGETLGIVGESGSGKSTLGKMIVRLEEPTSGQIKFAGRDIATVRGKAVRGYSGQVQMVFQDPYSSLNPFKAVEQALARPLRLHGGVSRAGRTARIIELLEGVGLRPGTKYLERYPHQLSGGERQRVAIARALSVQPELIVADEPVSSLDVSVRAQILRLLRSIQDDLGIAFFFITHDLAILPTISQRVAVMYKGRIVETGRTPEIIGTPRHPYTISLLASIPIPDPKFARRSAPARTALVLGELPAQGCAFSNRCPWADEKCRNQSPPILIQDGREVACFADRQKVIARGIDNEARPS